MINRTQTIGIRVEPELKALLEHAAEEDRRTVSSLIEKILVDWLKANGYLPPNEPKK